MKAPRYAVGDIVRAKTLDELRRDLGEAMEIPCNDITPDELVVEASSEGYKVLYRDKVVYSVGVQRDYYERKRKGRRNGALMLDEGIRQKQHILRGLVPMATRRIAEIQRDVG